MAELKNNNKLTGWTTALAYSLRVAELSGRSIGFDTTDGPINAEGREADVKNFHTKDFKSINANSIEPRPFIEAWEKGVSKLPRDGKKDYKQSIVLVNDNQWPIIKLELQTIPLQVRDDSNTQWNQVRGMGMNNPFQIYNGGEDTLTFEISWYATKDRDRSEVINKCRLLKSWSKADGYKASPPIIKIVWGDSDLFSEDLFIIASAPFQISNFQQAYKDQSSKEVVNLGLYPNTALQQLTLKKVSFDNQTYESIVKESALKTTPGVSFHC